MEHTPTRYKALAGIIRADLRAAGVTSDREAARRAGIATSTLDRRMQGEPFKLDELERLAALAGTRASVWLAALDSASVAA